MTHYVIDTNVAIVANGRGDYHLECRLACVEQIESIRRQARHRVVLDGAGAILGEYHRYLNPRGQPGVGDQFYRHLLNHQGNHKRVLIVELQLTDEGDYAEFPDSAPLAAFDRDDRKFVAAALTSNGIVVNAVDSDWKNFQPALKIAGVRVKQLCP